MCKKYSTLWLVFTTLYTNDIANSNPTPTPTPNRNSNPNWINRKVQKETTLENW
jgi:hypothetical protein